MTRLLSLAATVLLCAVIAQAQSRLAGRWTGETDGGASLELDLAVKAGVLTGTLVRNGQETKLSDGKASEKTFSFKATLNERTDSFSGALEGEQLKVWLDRQGPAKAVTLKRAEKKKV